MTIDANDEASREVVLGVADDLVEDAVASGLVEELPTLRHSIQDAVLTVGSSALAAVTLLRSPTAVRAFAGWLRDRCVGSKTSITLRATRAGTSTVLRVHGDMSVDAVADFITAALRGLSSVPTTTLGDQTAGATPALRTRAANGEVGRQADWRPRVFICYAHDSTEHKALVRSFAVFLIDNGIDVEMDSWNQQERRDWHLWAMKHIRSADFVLVIASPQCRSVGDGDIDPHVPRGLRSEMNLLRELHEGDPGTWLRRILPVVLPGRSVAEIPLFLQPHVADHYVVAELTRAGAEPLLRCLTGQPPYVAPGRGVLPTLPPASSSPSTLDMRQLTADLTRLRDLTNVDHERLFGVDEELARLADSLRNPDGSSIISVFGGAGVGKTALAYELVRRHAEEAGFTRIASVSAKFSRIDRVGHLERDAERENIDWHALLVELAQQLAPDTDFNDVLIEQQLPKAVPAAPCLIFVDNLETKEAEVAVRYLAGSGILGPHKVVITTREAVAGTGVGRLRELTWDGPNHAAASDYARYLADDDRMLDLRKSDLDDVVKAAERTPLLIQIIMNQARVERLPIRDVIGRLRDVSGNLGRAVWTYCYVNSLNVLERKLRDPDLPASIARERAADMVADLMAVFCARPAGTSITSEDFFRLSRIEDHDVFLRARAMACRLALVKSLKNNERFVVHSLLREFYCAQRGLRSTK